MKGNITPAQLHASRILIGQWLANLRKQKGLSQTELAAKAGIAPNTLSMLEAGKWSVSVYLIALLCLHLDHPLEKTFRI